MNYDVEILNRISPVKRSADVPYELIEGLRDLGSILKALAQIRRGRSIPSFVNASSVAGGYVKYQFGIKPYIRLIQDLSVLNQDMIRANLRLRKIEQKKRIRVNLLNETTEWTSTSFLSAGYTWTLVQGVPREHRQLDKIWAVGKLSLTPSGDSLLRRLSTSPAFFRRFQLNLGNVDIKTLWELTPWSWLADWVVDVSSALEAQRNSIYFQATSWNVMHYQTYRVHHKYSSRRLGGAENSLLEYVGGSYWREVKRRRVRASLQWHRARIEPILTLDRAAILSSILSSYLLGSSTYRPRR